jgi:phosphocarrier protein HPr
VSALTRTLPIINVRGLHARASRKFASLALEYSDVKITVRKDGDAADGTSLMDLMMLGAGIGSDIEVEAEGERAAAALDALTALVANRFGEDE